MAGQSFQGKRVFVTGGGGYFGHKLRNALKKKGADVLLFHILWPLDKTAYKQLECVQGDITRKEEVDKVFSSQRIDVVFHSASYGMSGREQFNREQIEKVNILGTKHVIEACCLYNVAHLVYTSTYNVVFGGQVIRNGDESLPYLPLYKRPDHYSRTKSIAEQFVLIANGSNLQDGKSLKTCALQPAGIYGEDELRHLPTIVAGEAYFISDDSPVNNFEFFRPLTEGLGYTMPKLKLPITLVYMVVQLRPCQTFQPIPHKFKIKEFEFVCNQSNPKTVQLMVIGAGEFNGLEWHNKQVYKSGVTHYFSMKKAHDDLGYNPQKYALNGVTEHFKKNGHGRHKHPSHLLYYLVNIVIGIMFACLLLAWLPRVDTCQVAGSF